MKLKRLRFPSLVAHFDNTEKIILRDYLALERTTLANERTLFAYIRTSLYLVLAGIAFITLEEFADMDWLGYTLFGISAYLIIFGLIRYFSLRKKLSQFYAAVDKLDELPD